MKAYVALCEVLGMTPECHDATGIMFLSKTRINRLTDENATLVKTTQKMRELLVRCLEIDDDAMLKLDEDKHPPSWLRVEIEEILGHKQ